MIDPLPGNGSELERFTALQSGLGTLFRQILPDRNAPRTVVVNPSLSLDPEILTGISGLIHYEERMLCMLMLLKLPHTRVVYLSSVPVDPSGSATTRTPFKIVSHGVPSGVVKSFG